jgi:hypothetical protein
MNVLRRRPPQRTQPLTGLESLPGQAPDERVETRQELARLREDLMALPHTQRAALVLRELSGFSHARIAEVLDETPAEVKQLIYQARAGLHAMAHGRSLACEAVQRRISEGDRRVLRARSIGAHIRVCSSCSGFSEAVASRPASLAALAPLLPLVVGQRILAALRDLAGAGATGGGAGATVLGAGTGAGVAGVMTGVGGGLAVKAAVVTAVVAFGASVPGGIGGSAAVPGARTPVLGPAPPGAAPPAAGTPAGAAAALPSPEIAGPVIGAGGTGPAAPAAVAPAASVVPSPAQVPTDGVTPPAVIGDGSPGQAVVVDRVTRARDGGAGTTAPARTPGPHGGAAAPASPAAGLGPPDHAGPPDRANAPEGAGPPAHAGPPDTAGPPEAAGRPDDAGPPPHAVRPAGAQRGAGGRGDAGAPPATPPATAAAPSVAAGDPAAIPPAPGGPRSDPPGR